MNELQDQLIQELQDVIAHLKKYDEQRWSAFFTKGKHLIEQRNLHGIDHLRNTGSGMGSFVDFVLCQFSRHRIEKHEEDFANKELMRLSSLVFTSADRLNRILNRKK